MCHSSEVRKWNVTATGNLMTKEMHVLFFSVAGWKPHISNTFLPSAGCIADLGFVRF